MLLTLLFHLVDVLFAVGMAGSILVLVMTGLEDAITIFHSIFGPSV